MVTDKMIEFAGDIEEFFVWAKISYEPWENEEDVRAWLNKYVPTYKRAYAELGRDYIEHCRLSSMTSWNLQYL